MHAKTNKTFLPNRPRILIAEGNEIMQLAYELYCTTESYNFYIVSTGHEATSAFDSNDAKPFDIVLLAMRFSDMDGLKIIEKLRVSTKGRTVPIIVYSGLGSVYREQCLRAGANEVLEKPTPRSQLSKVLRDKLQAYNVVDTSGDMTNMCVTATKLIPESCYSKAMVLQRQQIATKVLAHPANSV